MKPTICTAKVVASALGVLLIVLVASITSASAQEERNLPEQSSAPISAKFELITRLDKFHVASGRPWSPRGTFLAVTNEKGIHVIDATRPTDWPRALLAGESIRFSWSPDGEWLACNTRYGDPMDNQWAIVAINVKDGELFTLHAGQPSWPFLWASDGNIYFWERDSREVIPTVLSPPKRWKDENPMPFEHGYRLLPKTSGRRLTYMRFAAVPEPILESVSGLRSLGASHVVVYDEFPDGRNFLIRAPGVYPDPWDSIVIDETGSIVYELDGEITWTSVSSDGHLLAGFASTSGEEIQSLSPLFVGDVSGSWEARLVGAPNGMNPRFSRKGYFLAYENKKPLGLRLGRVAVRSE